MAYKIGLSPREQSALKQLAKKKGMNQRTVLRQAFRVYQTIEARLESGDITPKQLQDLLSPPLLKKKRT